MHRAGPILVSFLLTGCVAAVPPPTGRADLLAFIGDGRTTRQEAEDRLGTAYARYEGGRIMTWRLTEDAGGYVLTHQRAQPGEPQWIPNHELVLVFDADGLLVRHTLVSLRPTK